MVFGMKVKIFEIDLDLDIIGDLRSKINNERHISMNKKFTKKIGKNNKEFYSWDLVCATMDRIQDTAEYLNSLKLNTGEYSRSAFDFINFISNAMTMIECIEDLAKTYEVSFENENKKIDVFNELGKDGQGSDLDFFKYIRSLCSGHPSNTSHYSTKYQDNDFECSPFVLWNNGVYSDEYDIHIVVYTSEKDKFQKNVNLKIEKVFQFIKYRYNLIKKVADTIEKYQQKVIDNYKIEKLKKEIEFTSYLEYLYYLKNVQIDRLGNDNIYLLEYSINVFEMQLSNERNTEIFEKYKETLRYAIKFLHNEIQNMTREGFENCGIKGDNIFNGNLLEFILFYNCNSKEAKKYHYNIEKIGYLNYDSGYINKNWAYTMLRQMIPFLEQYVTFENATGDMEHYILVNIALFFDSLKTKCELNDNIPNDLKYRMHLVEGIKIKE